MPGGACRLIGRGDEVHTPRAVDVWGADRVADAPELRRHLGEEPTSNRHEPITCSADREFAVELRVILAGEGAVLIEHRCPHLGLHAEQIRAGRRRGIRALTPRLAGEHGVGGQHPLAPRAFPRLQQRAGHGDHPVDAGVAVEQRPTHRR